ncbi:MAG: flavohemoglobin expression-modulating QEGLA motif protein [Planctomycetes bacterium]|nr:flavohemoglobin expression-modulating QEGLA motif protein [Planctomycetota bacterium]
MQNITKDYALKCILEEKSFSGVVNGIFIDIKEYVPSISTAIHNGHNVSPNLEAKFNIDANGRLYEEDPFTGELISSQAIRLVALNSRYEYDLNRSPKDAIYDMAWGKKVWANELTNKERQNALNKHRTFYQVLHSLVAKCEQLFGSVVLYDIHSYNSQRILKDTPDINIGTFYCKQKKWQKDIQNLQNHLSEIVIDQRDLINKKNTVFYGKGYLARYISEHFDKTLVLPLEFKKFFMDEESGQLYPLVLSSLKEQLKSCFEQHSRKFVQNHSPRIIKNNISNLPSDLEPVILEIDRALYNLTKGLDVLSYVNPINLQQERSNFFKSAYRKEPNFKYKQLTVDPYMFREKLYRLPLQRIQDSSIQRLYQQTIDSMASKINLLTSIGSEEFLYNSLICYGEPDIIDIRNAQFIMYSSPFADGDSDDIYDVDFALLAFKSAMLDYEIDFPIVVSSKIIAGAMVDNNKKKIILNPSRKWSKMNLDALIHHELGVHALTTANAEEQVLNIFKIGLPGNTETQEGLAILSEFCSGNLTLGRLKTLATRNIAIHAMLNRNSFRSVFEKMVDECHLSTEEAFRVTSRAFRGGGFTKDHLYLKGFQRAYQNYSTGINLNSLFIGKAGFDQHHLLNELIQREVLTPPKHLPMFLSTPACNNPITDYLVSSIRPSQDNIVTKLSS